MAKHSVDFSHITAGALALALLPALWPSDAAAHTCDAPFSTDLIAGQTIDAGDVKVCNDDTTLTVTYEATFPWCLLKTDLHVATSKSGIPQNKNGHPTPGKFAYGEEYGGCLDGTASFEIPLDDIGDGLSPRTPCSSPPTPRSSTKTGARRAPGARAPASSSAAPGRCTSPTRSRLLPCRLRASATVEREPAARLESRY